MEALRENLTRRYKFAWAKYYERVTADHNFAARHYKSLLATQCVSDAVPTHIKDTIITMATELKKKWECPICLDFIAEGEVAITNCGHFYCESCLKVHKQTQKAALKPVWECAVCRKKHKYD